MSARRPRQFDPHVHEGELRPLLAALARAPALDARGLDRLVRRHPKAGRGLFARSEIIAGYRALGGAAGFGVDEAPFLERLRLRPVRTLSGVTPVTVLTRPFPCPGRCIFCPNDVRMPKSYLSQEPGAQRAEDNRFDPYLQTWNRLRAYREMGHPTSKVELIVLGGTWSFHPEAYQRWFVARCLEAMNDFGAGEDRRREAGRVPARWRELPARLDGAELARSYNRWVGEAGRAANGGAWLHPAEVAGWERVEAAQRANESAGARCVGLSLETRPDSIDAAEARRLRRLGATKLQVGIQSLDDAVLWRNRRGHDAETTRRALTLLRRFGFKLQGHWMANLLGATPESDAADFARLFDDPALRPDELKLYPCLLVESAELMGPFRRGEWRPYTDEELVELLVGCLARTPGYCRLTRVIRDFSSRDIVAGTRTANLREVAERRLRERGGRAREIRSREIRGARFDARRVRRRELRYRSRAGAERFLQLETGADASGERRLAAFLRLTLPAAPAPLPELEGRALVRELHVYGASLELGRRGGAPQHAGLGRELLARAGEIAREAGFRGLAVISAVGTRGYYRSLGFADEGLYQVRPL